MRSQRSSRRILGALALLSTLGLLAAACGGDPATIDEAAEDGSTQSGETVQPVDGALVTAWPSDIATLDPAYVRTDQDKELTFNIYERLVEYEFEENEDGAKVWTGLDVQPGLAESWQIDGPTITFTLRQGVTFPGSGNPFTAEDVKFSFDRTLMREGGHGDYKNAGLNTPEQIEVIDDHTLRITFTDENGVPVEAAASLASLRMPPYGIVDSKLVLENATEDDPRGENFLQNNAAGTGPYQLVSHSPGEEIALEAVPGHWNGEVAFPEVTIRIVANANVAALVGQGEIDVATFGMTPKDFADVEANGFDIVHVDTPDMIYMQFPADVGPLADQRVRQAIAYAMPYQQFIDVAFDGLAKRNYSYVNDAAPAFVPAWDDYETDLDTARDLLADAGVEELSLNIRYSDASPAYEDMALLAKDSLAQIGIELSLIPTPYGDMFSTVLERSNAGSGEATQMDIVMTTLSIYLDDGKSPVEFYHEGALNYSRVREDWITDLHNEFKWQPDTDERNAAYAEIQEAEAEAVRFLPLLTMGRTYALGDGVTGVAFSPEIATRFWMLERE